MSEQAISSPSCPPPPLTPPKMCSYISRQGARAGQACANKVSQLDPQRSHCSTHYKVKSVQMAIKSPIEQLLDEVAKLREEIQGFREVFEARSKLGI